MRITQGRVITGMCILAALAMLFFAVDAAGEDLVVGVVHWEAFAYAEMMKNSSGW